MYKYHESWWVNRLFCELPLGVNVNLCFHPESIPNSPWDIFRIIYSSGSVFYSDTFDAPAEPWLFCRYAVINWSSLATVNNFPIIGKSPPNVTPISHGNVMLVLVYFSPH